LIVVSISLVPEGCEEHDRRSFSGQGGILFLLTRGNRSNHEQRTIH